MEIVKVLSKQLFGAKYEHIVKSLVTCLILFLAVRITEIKMEIAPAVLFLAATVCSAGLMWQALHSLRNADYMAGLFMLPFTNRKMVLSIVLVFTSYTLLTKTFPVLALFFAVGKWSTFEIAVALLCSCNGCFMAVAWYLMTKGISYQNNALLYKNRKQIPFVDAYVFYHFTSTKHLIRHSKGTGNIFLYFLRYLIMNKNYLLNTAVLCVVGTILPIILGQFEGVDIMPLGFAIFCLNTPICILLSCDPDLEQAVRVLPGQARRFYSCYGFFVFLVNLAVSSVYLLSWQIQYGGVGGIQIMTAVLIALQSAILSILLEWHCPIRNWKTENDVWHHPRKYIVPFIMMLIAGLIGMWPISIWILFGVVTTECFVLHDYSATD